MSPSMKQARLAFYLDTLRLPIGDAQAPLGRTQALLTPKQHGAGSPDSANLAPGGQLSLAFDQLEIETVAEYNDIRETACDPPGPLIEEVRWCLVSGGVYRHPNVSKVDVARITIQGMKAARGLW
ncbi:unnamed protein product [Effrenium voratum]|nr:unnamed protein product [Effrenium voratum]